MKLSFTEHCLFAASKSLTRAATQSLFAGSSGQLLHMVICGRLAPPRCRRNRPPPPTEQKQGRISTSASSFEVLLSFAAPSPGPHYIVNNFSNILENSTWLMGYIHGIIDNRRIHEHCALCVGDAPWRQGMAKARVRV
jgi:hypothetical protein